MSSSLLYHTWGVRGIVYLATHYSKQTTCFRIKLHPNVLRCSHCGSRDVQTAGSVDRVLQTLCTGSA